MFLDNVLEMCSSVVLSWIKGIASNQQTIVTVYTKEGIELIRVKLTNFRKTLQKKKFTKKKLPG